ncbi:MAG: hypothetical protein PWQ97_442 [Tepidanaerobacteraceae bacterium]|nr:hypothetical protein [Tepidanaerobacteraceae bacterium]
MFGGIFFSIFFIALGAGALLGLLYIIVRYVPLLLYVIIGGTFHVLKVWFKAARDGFIEGYNKK